jgi:hypothetical protein
MLLDWFVACMHISSFAGSGMTSRFVNNTSAADAALTPHTPACRCSTFTAIGDFTAPGRIIDVHAAGGEQLLSFMLTNDAATAECLAIQPVTFVGIQRLNSHPSSRNRSSQVTPSALSPKFAVDVSLTCEKGLYSVAVPLPLSVGTCHAVALRLADGTSRHAVIRDVGP